MILRLLQNKLTTIRTISTQTWHTNIRSLSANGNYNHKPLCKKMVENTTLKKPMHQKNPKTLSSSVTPLIKM